jgi:two-component system sensor histidine kinase BaeS
VRRRLTIAIVGSVAAALLVAGLGTLLLVRRGDREAARAELLRQAVAVAGEVDSVQPRVLVLLSQTLHLQGATVLRLGPRGGIVPTAEPPPLQLAPREIDELAAGRAVSGSRGSLVFAAAPARTARGGRAAILLTRHAGSATGKAARWFLLSALLALAGAAVVADRVARRISTPLGAAELATGRIARGDLDSRVPDDGGADPELASLARSINTMAERLAHARGTERQFLLSISHELRTPLTSIQGFAEAIADGAVDDDRQAAFVIAGEAKRLERLVGDLLDLARLDARQFTFEPREVDLAEIVGDVAAGFDRAAHADDVAIDIEHVTGPALVHGDPDRLAQVVANLVENGLKFAATRVAVIVEAGRDEVLLCVDDDGPGIAAEDLPTVFDRLTTGRAPARRIGTGLGLAIVRELVGAMGGRVAAMSPPPRRRVGTRLEVRLPSSR